MKGGSETSKVRGRAIAVGLGMRANFDDFCETMRNSEEPWSDFKGGPYFEIYGDLFKANPGFIGRVTSSAFQCVRTQKDVSHSSTDSIMLYYVLSGEMAFEQSGLVNSATSGDLVLLDSARPLTVTHKEGKPCRKVLMRIPKTAYAFTTKHDDWFSNVLVARSNIIPPLASCLTFFSEQVSEASTEQLAATYKACASFLPVASGAMQRADAHWEDRSSLQLHKQILALIQLELSNPDLNPSDVASRFGISVRYLHYLFARSGSTFSSYLTRRRLEAACRELTSGNGRIEISSLAFRWGFKDLSTFHRAFKRTYGCSPRRFRISAP